ncbi:cytochrome p450 monooxygenase [Trichoderma arundinaceum]|uniref:Cholesterol side-chain cleavage enzyme, mitochondrial n=1 Tax=Trichoderma arundinaceum TaxID=490622 RepID=A0A395NPM9_TRIAR|nr:cytochrome p450 monooxygenase [Trichoderma arundinaceum]
MQEQLQEIIPLRESIWNEVIKGGISRFSFSRFLLTSTNRTLKAFKKKWTQFNDQAYERASKEYPNHPIVILYAAVEQGTTSKTELLHTLDEALFANLDVTIGNFSWNPVFLAADQSAQEDLRQEIRESREKESVDSWEQYLGKNSTLLMASILESARLKPMAPFSIAQATPTDRVVGEYMVPADPYWGKDSSQFWRYGFGPRQCLGKNVADVILKVLLAHLVENYRMTLSERESMNSEDWKRKPDVWISLAISDIICEEL